jgi:hypothetical protein
MVLSADIIEKGTDTGGNITSVPHSVTGLRKSSPGVLVEPEALDSEGGNVGSVDGSVAWRKQMNMRPHPVFFNTTSGPNLSDYIGYW